MTLCICGFYAVGMPDVERKFACVLRQSARIGWWENKRRALLSFVGSGSCWPSCALRESVEHLPLLCCTVFSQHSLKLLIPFAFVSMHPPPPFLYPLAKCTDIVDMCCSQSAVRQSRFSLHRSHAHTPNLSQVFVCYKSLPLDLFPCCSSYLFSLASSDWYRSVRQTQWTQPANRWRGP